MAVMIIWIKCPTVKRRRKGIDNFFNLGVIIYADMPQLRFNSDGG